MCVCARACACVCVCVRVCAFVCAGRYLSWRRGSGALLVRWRGCLGVEYGIQESTIVRRDMVVWIGVEYGIQGSKIARREQRRVTSQTSKAFTQRGQRLQRPCRQFMLDQMPLLSSVQASLLWRGEHNVGQETIGPKNGTCSTTLRTEESA